MYLRGYEWDLIPTLLIRALFVCLDRGVLLPPWHGKAYLGGAHGLSGILCTLLDASTIVPFSDEDMRLVRESIHYLRSLALPSGNYPSRPDVGPFLK
jgi:hypothetical protein